MIPTVKEDRMTRIHFAATLFTALASGLGYAQPAATPAFEVATIKPTDLALGVKWIRMPPNGELTTRGTSLKDLIQFAYGLHPNLIGGTSGWMESERYDVIGKPEPGKTPREDELKAMLRTLLADRFKLTCHRAPKDTSVYVLVSAKSGLKMKERRPVDGASASLSFQGARLPGRNVSISMLADALQAVVLDRPVVDGTGLKGNYDFDLVWTPGPDEFGGRGSAVPSDASAPDIFTAIQEQLGLRLDSRKTPVESLIVDHAEKPSDN
jgi:uncharacterized protein (TIGR03435 family)